VFIIVPAGELFLPIALKFFPNLLPSTYEDQKQKDAKMTKLRTTRKDVSQFIRTTMKEGGILPIGAKTRQREEFTQFFKKVHPPRRIPGCAANIGPRSVAAENRPPGKNSSRSARSSRTTSRWTTCPARS
jgi:hypothetical protein